MPRYDFQCLDCNGQTIIYLHENEYIDHRVVCCDYCNSDVTQLISYCENAVVALTSLQHEVFSLTERVDDLMQELGESDSVIECEHEQVDNLN